MYFFSGELVVLSNALLFRFLVGELENEALEGSSANIWKSLMVFWGEETGESELSIKKI